jgi:Mg/Co/Ni transporter MgtE
MTEEGDAEWTDEADEREQIAASIVVNLFEEQDLKEITGKMPYADAAELFSDLHRMSVAKVMSLSEESRQEFLSDLLNELNWNYIVNDILNEAAEAGFFKDGETKLLKDEAQS